MNMRRKKKYAITCPYGTVMWSIHTCNLEIPWLPIEMTEAHIVSYLAHASLTSTHKFSKVGCQVVFSEEACRVYYNGKCFVVRGREDQNCGNSLSTKRTI